MISTSIRGALAVFAGALLAGCESTAEAPMEAPSRAQIIQEQVVEARVQSVDPVTREIGLLEPDGSSTIVVAGPEVINFAQIRVGDTVRSRYRESLTAIRLEPGDKGMEPSTATAVRAAKPGAKPGVGIATGVAVTVAVQAVDMSTHEVTVVTSDGYVERVRARRDEGRRFVEGLKPGDRVTLMFDKALAITVEP